MRLLAFSLLAVSAMLLSGGCIQERSDDNNSGSLPDSLPFVLLSPGWALQCLHVVDTLWAFGIAPATLTLCLEFGESVSEGPGVSPASVM